MAHKGRTNACSFAPSGRRLVTGGDDAVLRIWSVKSGERVAKLKGHKGPVTCCTWDPSAKDKRIVSADAKGAIKVWIAQKDYTPCNDEEGGDGWAPDWSFHAHEASVLSISFMSAMTAGMEEDVTVNNSARSRLASCSRDGTVKLWCLKTMAELACVIPAKVSVSYYHPISAALCGPGGSWAFVCGNDGLCHLLDFGSSSEIGCTDLGSKAKCCAATWLDCHANGAAGWRNYDRTRWASCIGVGCDDGSLRAMLAENLRDCVLDIFESRGALTFARGQVDRDHSFCDENEDHQRASSALEASHLEGRCVALSLSGRRVLVIRGSSEDGDRFADQAPIVSVHHIGVDRKTTHVLGIPEDTHFDPTCSAISPSERFAVVGSEDGTICVWDLGSIGEQPTVERENVEGGKQILKRECAGGERGEEDQVHDDGNSKARAGKDEESTVGSETGEKAKEKERNRGNKQAITRIDLVGHEEAVLCIAFSANGEFMVSCGWESRVRCWNVTSSGCSAMGDPQETEHGDWIKSCAFRPGLASKGNVFATASNDGEVRFWDTGLGDFDPESDDLTFVLIGQIEAHLDGVNSICFSPDGLLLVTTSDDATAKVWAMSEEIDSLGLAKPLRSLLGHAGPVTSAAFIGAERVVTCSWDRTVRVWTTEEGTVDGIDDFEFADELPEELRQGKQELRRVGGFYADLVHVAAVCGKDHDEAAAAVLLGNVAVISREGSAHMMQL